jgi:NitT/TauT family transport system substrate-binding protein
LIALIVALAAALSSAAAFAEASTIHFPLGAGGFGFLPLSMMQKYKLIEKYAAEAGVKLDVEWATVGGGPVMNDALLSGSADFITAGPPSFLYLWDRTQGNLKVKSLTAVSSIPMFLNVRSSALSAIDDIKGQQRIGLWGVKVAIPAILMQMYATRKYGKAQAFKFDPFMVNLTHPEAAIALTSGSGDIVANWASLPYHQMEIRDKAIKTLMNSDQVIGGPTTFTMISTTTKFASENPKICAAVIKALKEAMAMIEADKRNAAQVLLDSMGGKGWTVDEFVSILNDPNTRYTTRPENVLTVANFMHDVGSLKHKPASIGDLFFDPAAIGGGN